jgi:hypothetical protein
MKQYLRRSICAISFLLMIYFGLSLYVSKNLKFNFLIPKSSEAARPDLISTQVAQVESDLRNGLMPSRLIDQTSVGLPEKEALLLKLRTQIDFFVVSFSHQPTTVAELQRLSELPNYPQNGKRILESFDKCQILNLKPDSYILNCDGWKLTGRELETLVNGFDEKTEKFYRIDEHVIWFVPPPSRTKRTPLG